MKHSFPVIKVVALAILMSIAGVTVFAQQSRPANEAKGKLKGVVVDWNYARIADSCLTIRSKTHQVKVMVDESGAFEVELPAGTYEVVALSPHFSRVRRKNVRVEPDATRTQNFILPVAPEISGQCPSNTVRRGELCESLCDMDPIPKLGKYR